LFGGDKENHGRENRRRGCETPAKKPQRGHHCAGGKVGEDNEI